MFLHVKLCEIMSSNIKKKLRTFFHMFSNFYIMIIIIQLYCNYNYYKNLDRLICRLYDFGFVSRTINQYKFTKHVSDVFAFQMFLNNRNVLMKAFTINEFIQSKFFW